MNNDFCEANEERIAHLQRLKEYAESYLEAYESWYEPSGELSSSLCETLRSLIYNNEKIIVNDKPEEQQSDQGDLVFEDISKNVCTVLEESLTSLGDLNRQGLLHRISYTSDKLKSCTEVLERFLQIEKDVHGLQSLIKEKLQ